MRPTSRDLAMRDPALAAMLGALPGADFGYHPNFGYQPDFGDEAQAAAAWQRQQGHTDNRERLLQPNKGSTLKVQRYTFSLNVTLTALGTPQAGLSSSNAPDTNFRPQRVSINTPAVGFIYARTLRVANVNVLVGGIADSYQFNPNAVESALDMPTLSPANKATFEGDYSGTTPAPLSGTNPFLVAVSFTGPASIVA